MIVRVTVTGGAGYLGSVLCRELVGRGHEVLAVDSLLYGGGSLSNLEREPRFRLLVADLRDHAVCERAVRWADVVVHLAAIVGDPAGDIDPDLTIDTNLHSTHSLAHLCRHNKRKLVYASTCSVYGSAPGRLVSEGHGTEGPVSLYGRTKLHAEREIQDAGPPGYAILRMGTLFGDSPRRRFDLVANLFMAKAILGETLRVQGGAQYRPFLHVADAADAYADAIEQDWGGVLNIASHNIRIDELAQEVSASVAPPVRVVFDLSATDPRDYRVDSQRARRLGFSPFRTFEDAVWELQRPEARDAVKRYAEAEFSNVRSLEVEYVGTAAAASRTTRMEASV